MNDSLSDHEFEEIIKNKDKEISFLKEELLKAAHQLERFSERVEKQNEISKGLLNLLSPTKLAKIPGYEISSKYISSTGAGGEYLEILNFSEKHRFGVLMSHSSGYGLSAVFLACLLKYSAQLQSSRKWSTKTFIKNIEKELRLKMNPEDRAAILYGVMDRAKSQFEFSGAGNYKFILLDAKSKATIIPMKEVEIELEKDWSSFSEIIKVEFEETLIILSPGFCNSLDSQSQKLNDQQILSRAQQIGSSDLHDLRNELLLLQQEHTQLQKPARDTSLVLWRNLDRSLKLASIDTES